MPPHTLRCCAIAPSIIHSGRGRGVPAWAEYRWDRRLGEALDIQGQDTAGKDRLTGEPASEGLTGPSAHRLDPFDALIDQLLDQLLDWLFVRSFVRSID